MGERYDALKRSLEKFGWLVPAYVNEAGMLLSGHQRTAVWKELGGREVPVVTIRGLSDDAQRSVNILFNLATNDMTRIDLGADLWKEFEESSAAAAARETDFPCLKLSLRSAINLARDNGVFMLEEGWQYARSLLRQGIMLPIVLGSDGRIASGRQRLCCYLRMGYSRVPVIHAGFPAALIASYLNNISMDFQIRETYSNELRHNSYRRPTLVRKFLGHGFSGWISFGTFKRARFFDHRKPRSQRQLRKRFGRHIVDFGAGHLSETKMLREAGLNVYPFEPYHIVGSSPHLERSREICMEFVRAVEEGVPFSAIVISSVLNSVPFAEDRADILRIVASLDCPVYICTIGRGVPQAFITERGESRLNQRQTDSAQMRADYEENVLIGELGHGRPKAQKFYGTEELLGLVREFFCDVKGFTASRNIYVRARNSKPVNKKELQLSLQREFSLPYPEGRTLGLGPAAISAWRARGIL